MSISLSTLIVRHERRLRLVFSNDLAPGAFDATLYVLTASECTVPVVVEPTPVPGSANAVDLSFDRDLSQGQSYTVSAAGVPAVDTSVTPAPSTLPFMLGASTSPPDVEVPEDDIGALAYGTDILFDGRDFVEQDNGDLADISGIPNFEGAMNRRLAEEIELPWSPGYGARPGAFVNGPRSTASTLRGTLLRQACADDRTKSADAVYATDPSDPGEELFTVSIVPKGAPDGAVPVSVSVPLND